MQTSLPTRKVEPNKENDPPGVRATSRLRQPSKLPLSGKKSAPAVARTGVQPIHCALQSHPHPTNVDNNDGGIASGLFIKAKAEEVFGGKVNDDVTNLLDFAPKAIKTNYMARAKELEIHAAKCKDGLKMVLRARDQLVEAAMEREARLASELRSITAGRRVVEEEAKQAKALVEGFKAEQNALLVEKEAHFQSLRQQLLVVQDQYREQIEAAKAETKAMVAGRMESEERAQRMAIEVTRLEGERQREHDRQAVQHATIEALRAEMAVVNMRLGQKGDELSSALQTFDRQLNFAHARIQSMEQERREAEVKMESERAAMMERQEREREEMNAVHARDRANLDLTITQIAHDKARVEGEKQDMALAMSRMESALEAERRTSEALRKEVESIRSLSQCSTSDQFDRLCKLSVENELLKQQLATSQHAGVELIQVREELVEMTKKFQEAEAVRRQLHNKVQELRGNVRVLARVRPALPSEDGGAGFGAIECHPDGKQVRIRVEGKEHQFGFDTVFGQQANQCQVFHEVSQLVQSALDGYDVCLFSYGQTGSGKTHTMQGAPYGDERGIIPRAIEKVMEVTSALARCGWRFQLEASFCEVYLDNVYDLLSKERKALDIKLEGSRTHIPGLTSLPIDSKEQIEVLLSTAARARSVASTSMNEHSSRSHSIFTLKCTGVEEGGEKKGVVLRGSLNLCDLAGSERVSRSQVEGDELTVTQSINKSLSALALVFNSLSNKSAHIPYRNSKLTYLLQHCFSGQGKALMIVNLSPGEKSAGESLCSLRFAQNVNNTVLGRAVKHVQVQQEGTHESQGPNQHSGAASSSTSIMSSSSLAPNPKRQATGFGSSSTALTASSTSSMFARNAHLKRK